MRLSIEYPETTSVARLVDLARGAESRGFDTLFAGSAFGFDPLMALMACSAATTTLQLGTAVVPTWPRHPLVMAQQALTAQSMSGGRFRLGGGVSHAPVMKMYGIDFDRPLVHAREYLTVLRALMHEGNVKFRGERYSVAAAVVLDDAQAPPPILLAALRSGMARLAGEVSDGAIPWLVSSAYLRDVIVPAVHEGAARAARAVPPVIASVPVVWSGSAEAALARVQHDLAIYPHMPFYRASFAAAGVEVPDDARWTPAMLDAAVVWGDGAQITQRLEAYFRAGASEVVCSPFGPPELIDHLSGLTEGAP
jgi:F420-dependent oxidoreductase-like protein